MRMSYRADTMQGRYLFGERVSAADFYLFVMLLWAQKNGVNVPAKLDTYRDDIMALPSVKKAMGDEGLI